MMKFKKGQNMNLKEYKNMNSFELEKHLQEILASEKAKEFPKYAELEKLHKELKQQNFIKLLKQELMKK